MKLREPAYGGAPEATRLRDIHSKPLQQLPSGTYRCPRCDILWWLRPATEMQVSCGVLHSQGECCHYSEQAWVANG